MPEYKIGDEKIVYIRKNSNSFEQVKLYLLALVLAERGEITGPVKHLQDNKYYKELLYPKERAHLLGEPVLQAIEDAKPEDEEPLLAIQDEEPLTERDEEESGGGVATETELEDEILEDEIKEDDSQAADSAATPLVESGGGSGSSSESDGSSSESQSSSSDNSSSSDTSLAVNKAVFSEQLTTLNSKGKTAYNVCTAALGLN